MPKFEKGKSGNPAGRPKGVPSKTNLAFREFVFEGINKRREQIFKDLDSIQDPATRLNILLKLLPYFLPRATDPAEMANVCYIGAQVHEDYDGRLIPRNWKDMQEEAEEAATLTARPTASDREERSIIKQFQQFQRQQSRQAEAQAAQQEEKPRERDDRNKYLWGFPSASAVCESLEVTYQCDNLSDPILNCLYYRKPTAEERRLIEAEARKRPYFQEYFKRLEETPPAVAES